MRKTLLTLSLGFAFAACADHSGTLDLVDGGPSAPINQPDTKVADPGVGTGNGIPDEPQPAGNGGEGGSNHPGNNGGGSNPGSGPGPGGTGSAGGQTGGGEGGGGAPVPEPGTLLLVGSGLAGAALLRRRRQQKSAD